MLQHNKLTKMTHNYPLLLVLLRSGTIVLRIFPSCFSLSLNLVNGHLQDLSTEREDSSV